MPGLGYFGSLPSTAIFYALFNGQNGDGVYAIGAANRTNGTWTEYASNPVISKGSGWESAHVKDPCLVYVSGTYYCYYSGYNGSVYQIGRASAPSYSGPWTKAGGNPLISVGAGGSVDEKGCAFPTILYEPSDTGKEWKCWYRAQDASGNLTICYAYSTDGLTFSKQGKVLDVGSAGAWDVGGVLPGAIYKSGSTYYLFYGGYKNSGGGFPQWQGGYATFTNPTGTYTKYASNPTIKARFNDASTSVSLTADLASGASQATMTTTAAFNVGEAVIVADGSSVNTAEAFYVVSVDSGTKITVDHPAAHLLTGSGGVFRSFAYNSIIPRSILVSATGFEAFCAPFQAVEDLSIPITTLREGSFGMTQASVLTGNWSYAYVTGQGLFFPLYSGTAAAWRTYSAENPSVIAAP